MTAVIIFVLIFGIGGVLRIGYEHWKGGDRY